MIKIDIDTRCWKIPKEECFLGVESDDKVKILRFELSKNEFFNGLNFTDCNCFINYKNEGNDTIPYGITDMEVQEDGTVTFTWQVSRGATIFKGNTFAVLCAKKVRDDGTITNEWNSRIGSFIVAKGIEPLSSIAEVPEIDIISQLLLVAKQTNAKAETNINQSSQLLEKAEGLGYLKEDFDVLEARMNQFTSLKEGATTGDAELIDGRIGYDGKVYENIGGAIRGQVSELKSDLDEHREEFYCVYNHFDKDNVLASTYYKSSGTGSNAGYCAEKIKVKKGVKYYSNNINSIRKEFSFFEKSDGTRTLLDGQNNISVIGSVYLQFNGYEPLEDGYLCLTLGAGTFDNLMLTNNEYVNDFYPYKKLIKAFTLGENIIVGKIEEKDIDFIKTVSNLVEYDKLVNDSYWTKTSKTIRKDCGYKTIEIPVKEGHVYSSNAYINNQFSFYNNGIGTIDRTYLTTYTDFIYNGSTSVLMGIKKFVAPSDGSLCITVNVDYVDKLVIIEGDYCPKVNTNYNETFDVYIKDTPLKIHKTIYVEKDRTGHFDTIKDAIEYVNTHPNIEFTVYVGNGVYDLIEEFGDEYFANIGNESRAGLKLDNNVHLIFSSNSKVVCNYTGDNVNVKKNFSPFNTNTAFKQRGFTIENLNLECSNVRYAIHDETSGQTEPYRNIYKNCFMKLDNSNNSYGYPQCIGGGLGNAGEIIIKNCYFESIHADKSEAIVSYHNNSGAGVNRVNIDGCYFANKDTCRCSHLGSGTNISTMIVSNCSSGAEPFVIYEQAGAYENMRLIKWNNEIRG